MISKDRRQVYKGERRVVPPCKPIGIDMETVEAKFSHLEHDVKLIFFTREASITLCQQARSLFKCVAAVTAKIGYEEYNFAINKEKALEYGIFGIPALVMIGEKDYGIRYYGCPTGLEVANFLENIVFVSRGRSGLPQEIIDKIQSLDHDTHLKVFLSDVCPYSLVIAKLALRLAIACDRLSVDIIDATEFMEIAEEYNVRGIPMTVVNETKSFYGALAAEEYVNKILEYSAEALLKD
ncbi:MAG: thioredoxin family protein [Desulfobacterales bacterium]|nr:thioredoxin family protein [Desulfobacterales bacterium]MDD4073336.1 thioredoxin family protein [Desulfobacterales bacterium]MDD4391790.1 thioredoxin family protein [Desulfobacterales bacterium]